MISGSSRQRGSRIGGLDGDVRRCLSTALAALLLAVPNVLRALPLPVPPALPRSVAGPPTGTMPTGTMPTGPARAVIAWAPGFAAEARERAWLEADAVWLRGPAVSAAPALTAADTALTGGDGAAAAALRRRLAVAIVARGDTIAPLRGTASLLRDRWLSRGYLQAVVRQGGDTLFLEPGRVWTLGDWDVGGDDFPGRSRLLADWLPVAGSRFEAARVDDGARDLLTALGEQGHPFPRWVISDLGFDVSRREVTVHAALLPGPRAVIGPVTSDVGNARAANFLARASGLRRGAPVRGSDLGRAAERLAARDLYSELDVPLVYTTTSEDTVGIHFRARLRPKSNRAQVVLGVSRRADDGRARLSGEVDLALPNLAQSGRALRVGWRDDGAGRSRFGFSWLEPLAAGTPLDVNLALDSEVLDAAYTRFTTELGARLPVVALWGVELAGGWDRSTYPDGAIARTARTRARAAIVQRRGDRGHSGWEAAFAVESAWRSAQAREGEAGAASLAVAVRQRLLAGDVAGEAWLGRRTALAGRLSVRHLDGGEREATLAEHFRFGGAATLRGYAEGEFHGVEVAWASLEWRLGPPRGSRLYTFWDVGYFGFWSTAAAPAEGLERRRGWPRGYGLGLLARTPGGDLSLAVGFPGTVDFDLAKLHVTLLESF